MANESWQENILEAIRAYFEANIDTYTAAICAHEADGILCPSFDEVLVDDSDPFERSVARSMLISVNEVDDKSLTMNSEQLDFDLSVCIVITEGNSVTIGKQIKRYAEGLRQLLIAQPSLGTAVDSVSTEIKILYFPALPEMLDKRISLVTFHAMKEVAR